MGSLIKHLPLEYILNKPKTSNRTKDGLYREYNQWGPAVLEQQWFIRFLRHHFPDNKTVVNFFGPVGTPFFIKRQFEGKKVFYTGEDVEHPGTQLALYYGDYCLDHTDLSLGFGQVQHARYLRFPYWILTTFSPEDDAAAIKEKIKKINESHFEKSRECVLINKHDPAGTRELVYNGVKDILDVKLAGQWRNNTRELWDDFGNDKEAYIPLYYGALNDPEPGLINRDAVIFWNKEGKNEENREKIRELKQNESLYQEFMSRPKLFPAAAEYVIDRYAKLKEHFARILGY